MLNNETPEYNRENYQVEYLSYDDFVILASTQEEQDYILD